MRVVYRSPYAREVLAGLAAAHGVDFVIAEDDATARREVAGADALWLGPMHYDAAMRAAIEGNARLRWLQITAMGYEEVQEHGPPRGVTVTNAGDAFGPTVAEHALTLTLSLLRCIPATVRASDGKAWQRDALAPRIGTLVGATVTVYGFGTIGREIALRVRACGAKVIAVTRSAKPDPLADESLPLERFHDALSRSDVLVAAVPLTPQTRRSIDAAALSALAPRAVFVNIARGGVVDQAALHDALVTGRLAGAALDVAEPEPLPPDDPLWSAPNLLISPHVAGFGGTVAGRRLIALVERNLRAYSTGAPLDAVVFGA